MRLIVMKTLKYYGYCGILCALLIGLVNVGCNKSIDDTSSKLLGYWFHSSPDEKAGMLIFEDDAKFSFSFSKSVGDSLPDPITGTWSYVDDQLTFNYVDTTEQMPKKHSVQITVDTKRLTFFFDDDKVVFNKVLANPDVIGEWNVVDVSTIAVPKKDYLHLSNAIIGDFIPDSVPVSDFGDAFIESVVDSFMLNLKIDDKRINYMVKLGEQTSLSKNYTLDNFLADFSGELLGVDNNNVNVEIPLIQHPGNPDFTLYLSKERMAKMLFNYTLFHYSQLGYEITSSSFELYKEEFLNTFEDYSVIILVCPNIG